MAVSMTSELSAALQAYRSDAIDGAALVSRWESALDRSALPPRFVAVLDQLLTAVQSASLFDGAACAFDKATLGNQLQQWLDALSRLPTPASAGAPTSSV
jgi:hypothetical protein